MGPGLARQDAAGRVFGRFWNRTEPFFRSEPGPLAGYPDPLLTLVQTSASNHKKQTIRKVVAFSKQPAKADPIENTTSKTAKAPKVPQKQAPALDTGNYEVLGTSQLDYTILAGQKKETGELTF